jgi:TRAP-type C4-dicarboxylate transport system permease small subunit
MLLVTIVSFQVINRLFLHLSAVWTEELARFNFVWLSLVGAALCIKNRIHLAIDMVTSSVSEKIKCYMFIVVDILMIIFSVIFFYSGLKQVLANIGTVAIVSGFPLSIVFIIIPIVSIIFFLFSLELLGNGIKSVRDLSH